MERERESAQLGSELPGAGDWPRSQKGFSATPTEFCQLWKCTLASFVLDRFGCILYLFISLRLVKYIPPPSANPIAPFPISFPLSLSVLSVSLLHSLSLSCLSLSFSLSLCPVCLSPLSPPNSPSLLTPLFLPLFLFSCPSLFPLTLFCSLCLSLSPSLPPSFFLSLPLLF